MDDNLGYLFAAFAATWVGIAAYVYYVSQQVRTLRDEVAEIEVESVDRERMVRSLQGGD